MIKRLVLVFIIGFAGATQTLAQCAMCRATLEANVSNGAETTLSGNLNVGILYLFAAPYLIVAAVAYFWYRNSRLANKSDGLA